MKDTNASPEARLLEVFDLVGPLYRRAQRRVEQYTPAQGLSVGVRAVLTLLHHHGPQTVPQMARAQALSRQFVQRTVNEATARSLVEPTPNPSHKRSSLIRLTPEGTALITALTTHEHTLLTPAATTLTPHDITACLHVLSTLLTSLSDIDMD